MKITCLSLLSELYSLLLEWRTLTGHVLGFCNHLTTMTRNELFCELQLTPATHQENINFTVYS